MVAGTNWPLCAGKKNLTPHVNLLSESPWYQSTYGSLKIKDSQRSGCPLDWALLDF